MSFLWSLPPAPTWRGQFERPDPKHPARQERRSYKQFMGPARNPAAWVRHGQIIWKVSPYAVGGSITSRASDVARNFPMRSNTINLGTAVSRLLIRDRYRAKRTDDQCREQAICRHIVAMSASINETVWPFSRLADIVMSNEWRSILSCRN